LLLSAVKRERVCGFRGSGAMPSIAVRRSGHLWCGRGLRVDAPLSIPPVVWPTFRVSNRDDFNHFRGPEDYRKRKPPKKVSLRTATMPRPSSRRLWNQTNRLIEFSIKSARGRFPRVLCVPGSRRVRLGDSLGMELNAL